MNVNNSIKTERYKEKYTIFRSLNDTAKNDMCDYLKLYTTILISSIKMTMWRVITNEPRRDKHE